MPRNFKSTAILIQPDPKFGSMLAAKIINKIINKITNKVNKMKLPAVRTASPVRFPARPSLSVDDARRSGPRPVLINTPRTLWVFLI